MKENEITPLRAASRYFALAPLVMTAVMLIFVVGQVREWAGDPAGDRREPIALLAADMLPALFYLWALLALWATFRAVGRGATFEPTIARGLRQLGWALLGSGIASALIIPLVKVPIIKRAVASGTMEPGEHVVGIDAAYLMLVLVGIAILLVARLFAIAASIRMRNEALEAELGEFL